MNSLNEAQRRLLTRFVDLMRTGATGEMTVTMRQGGVIAYRESRSLRLEELPESSPDMDELEFGPVDLRRPGS